MTTITKTQTPDLVLSINKRGDATYQVNNREGVYKLLKQLNFPPTFYGKNSWESGVAFEPQYDGWSSRGESNGMRIQRSSYGDGNYGWTKIKYGTIYSEKRITKMLSPLKLHYISRQENKIRRELSKKITAAPFANALSDVSYNEFQYSTEKKKMMKKHSDLKLLWGEKVNEEQELYNIYQDKLDKYCKKNNVIWYHTNEQERLKNPDYKKYHTAKLVASNIEQEYDKLEGEVEKTLTLKNDNDYYIKGFTSEITGYSPYLSMKFNRKGINDNISEEWVRDRFGFPIELKLAFGVFNFKLCRTESKENPYNNSKLTPLGNKPIASCEVYFIVKENKLELIPNSLIINQSRDWKTDTVCSVDFTVKDMMTCSQAEFIDYMEQLKNKRNDVSAIEKEIKATLWDGHNITFKILKS